MLLVMLRSIAPFPLVITSICPIPKIIKKLIVVKLSSNDCNENPSVEMMLSNTTKTTDKRRDQIHICFDTKVFILLIALHLLSYV